MEQKFTAAWRDACEKAQQLGVRCKRTLDTLEKGDGVSHARRILSGSRPSDEFAALESLHRLDLSLEALVLRSAFGQLFTDEQVNRAIERLLQAGYSFRK